MIAPLWTLSPSQRGAFFEGYQSLLKLLGDYPHYISTFYVMRAIPDAADIKKTFHRGEPLHPSEEMRKYLQSDSFLFT